MNIETRLFNLENSIKTIMESNGMTAKTSDEKTDRLSSKTDCNLIKTVQTEADLEDAAITMADFMAEYYLSQFEGGEEE